MLTILSAKYFRFDAIDWFSTVFPFYYWKSRGCLRICGTDYGGCKSIHRWWKRYSSATNRVESKGDIETTKTRCIHYCGCSEYIYFVFTNILTREIMMWNRTINDEIEALINCKYSNLMNWQLFFRAWKRPSKIVPHLCYLMPKLYSDSSLLLLV